MSGESCEDISRDRRNLCDGINTTPWICIRYYNYLHVITGLYFIVCGNMSQIFASKRPSTSIFFLTTFRWQLCQAVWVFSCSGLYQPSADWRKSGSTPTSVPECVLKTSIQMSAGGKIVRKISLILNFRVHWKSILNQFE